MELATGRTQKQARNSPASPAAAYPPSGIFVINGRKAFDFLIPKLPLVLNMTDRRTFLKTAALGTGYALFIKAPQSLAAAESAPPSREEISPRLENLAGGNPDPGTAEPHMAVLELTSDVFVAGGGLAGVCAAIAAARNGSKVILVQDRSRLGGNASSEIRMHPMGSRFGIRETGLIEEFSLANAWQNPQHAWELWDLMLYDKVVREPNLRLLLDTTVYRAEIANGKISTVWARCDKTEHIYKIKSSVYIDATGDCRLALEAGATIMAGREPVEKYNEPLASYDKPGTMQGSSILFTSRKHDRSMPFEAPSWARVIGADDLQHRSVGPKNWEYGYWWIELGGVYDNIRDNERLRFELLAIVLGVWDYIKNSGNFPEADHWALETVGMLPGKRDSRRILGDHIMVQSDIEGGWKNYKDAVAMGGWPLDDHPALGFDAKDQKPFRPAKYEEAYNIPFGSLCAKDIPNLMMAGRNISASHVAFTSTRVMKTCAAMGQAVGTAAHLCVSDKILPRDIRNDPRRMEALQQQLLRDDQIILQQRNKDTADLAKKATVTASGAILGSKPENILSGVTWEEKGKTDHRWIGAMENGAAWIQLEWNSPVELSLLQLTHDTGLSRTLTISAAYSQQEKMIAGPQPETLADYVIMAVLPDGSERELAAIKSNYQRLRRHRFDPVTVKAIRIIASRSHGTNARLYEVRAYS